MSIEHFFSSDVYIKLVALRISLYPRSSSHFQKDWWPLPKQ